MDTIWMLCFNYFTNVLLIIYDLLVVFLFWLLLNIFKLWPLILKHSNCGHNLFETKRGHYWMLARKGNKLQIAHYLDMLELSEWYSNDPGMNLHWSRSFYFSWLYSYFPPIFHLFSSIAAWNLIMIYINIMIYLTLLWSCHI